MDPLSIASSIAGLMTLADVVFRRTFQYAREVKEAKKDVQNLANEIRDLAGILHNLSLTASALEGEYFDPNLRMHHVNACRHTLLQVDKRLAKAAGDLTGNSKLNMIQRKLKWPFSSAETKQLLQEMTRHKDTISLALSADSMNAILRCLTRQEDISEKVTDVQTDIKRVMEISTRIELDKKRQQVLNFFMKVNPQPNFEMSRKLRHPMTGLWLTEGEAFKSWLLHTGDMEKSRLWLSGIPGAGKTVLAGSIIEETLKECDNSVAVAFFFCNHGDDISQVPSNVLGAIAAQIARQSDEAFLCLDEYYQELHPSRHLSKSPSLEGLNQTIQEMTEKFDHVFIVVDGLDECGDETDNVVEELHSLTRSGESIRMALLSRNEQNIREKLEDDFLHIEIAAHKEDLQLYVPAAIEERLQTKKLRIKSTSFKDEIIRKLINDADGMFRWVACQIDYLCELPNDRARKDALNHLPPTLNATYERILERINSSNDHVRAMIQKVLQLTAWGAKNGYLTIRELCEAISISETTTYLDADDLIDVDEVTFRCSSLIRTSLSGRYLEFAHFTVREFLESDTLLSTHLSHFHQSDGMARELLAESGLRILNFAEFSNDLQRSKGDVANLGQRNKSHPFYHYACRNIPLVLTPALLENSKIFDLTKQLFGPTKGPNLVAWSLNLALYLQGDATLFRAVRAVRRDISSSHSDSDSEPASDSDQTDDTSYFDTMFSALLRVDFTPLHLAAILGLFKVCKYLLDNGADVNLRSRFGNPLHCAIGGLRVFDDEDFEIRSPACDYANVDACLPIIDLLLAAGAQGMEQIRTPYWRAPFSTVALEISFGFRAWTIFTHLLEIGMPLDGATLVRFEKMCDNWFRRASVRTHKDANDMVESLLATTANLKADNSAVAQLHSLAWDFGVKHRVPYILSRTNGPPPDILELPDESFFMTMTFAFEKDDVQFVKDTFADPRLDRFQQWHEYGYTLFHLGAEHCSVNCLELLFNHGLDPSVRDKCDRLPIHLCPTDDHEDALRVFVRHHVPTTSLDRNGQTLWHLAADYGSPHILSVLMEIKCEMGEALKITTADGHTPLSLALCRGNEEAGLLLLEHCDQEAYFQSPKPLLNYATEMASQTIIEKLLDVGEKPCHENPSDSTPLNFVTRKISLSCLKLLKSLYPGYSTGLADTETPLERYLKKELKFKGRHKEIVAELLGPVDAASEASVYRKLWELFCSEKVVEPTLFGKNPISSEGINDVLDLLLERGVMVTFEEESKLSGLQPLAKTYRELIIRFSQSHLSASSKGLSIPFNLDSRILGALSVLLKVLDKAKYFNSVSNDPGVVFILGNAVLLGKEDVALALLNRGIEVDCAEDGRTALFMGCIPPTSCRASLFEKILERADKTKLDYIPPEFELCLVHHLGYSGVLDAVLKLELLIKAGANPNIRTKDRNVHPALVWHIINQGVVSASALKLLDLGGDPTLKNNSDFDAALAAALIGNCEFLNALYHKQIATNRQFPWYNRCCAFKGDPAKQVNNASALHLAVLSNSTSCLKFYVEEGIFTDLDIEAEHGWTPLHLAAKSGHCDSMKFLLSHGANINAQGFRKVLPLHLAVQHQQVKAARLLVESGSTRTFDENGMRPLDYAKQLAIPGIISLLSVDESMSDISVGKSLQHKRVVGELGAKYLEAAITQGDLEMCQSLIARGVSIDCRLPSCHDCSPLLCSIQLEKPEIVQWLLDNGANTRTVYCNAHWSKCWGSPVTVVDAACYLATAEQFLPELLTKYVCHGGRWTDTSHNPLHTATFAGNKAAVDTFLGHVKENLAIHLYALSTYGHASFKLLLTSLPRTANNMTGNVSMATDEVLTMYVNQASLDDEWSEQGPLHVAVDYNQLDIAKTLLDHGAEINQKTDRGSTPLHFAAEYSGPTMVEFLLDRGAQIELRDQHLRTPLTIAIIERNFEVVKTLIEHGANNTVKNESNQNLLQIDYEWNNGHGNACIFAYLLDLGVDPTEISNYRTCALHECLGSRIYLHVILRRNLISPQAPPLPIDEFNTFRSLDGLLYAISRMRRCMPTEQLRSFIDIEPPGKTSLLCKAAASGLLDGMENLFEIGANIEHEGCEYGTALLAACAMGEFDSVRTLVRRGAKLVYKREEKTRSAVILAKPFSEIVEWLLVKRFMTQPKLERSSLGEGASSHEIQPWSGISVRKLDLKGTRRRKWDESSIEYAKRLCELRSGWFGGILPPYEPCP